MDIVLIVLRLIHILAAVAWFGLGFAAAFYIGPALRAAGDSGPRFLKALFNTTSFGRIFAILGGVTVLAGILLYIKGSPATYMTQTGQIVLGIGAVFGVLAAAHGGASTGRVTQQLAEEIQKSVPDGGEPIPAEAQATLRQLGAKMASGSRISFVLMLIALIGMSSARYL
jgi:hypothetical protein